MQPGFAQRKMSVRERASEHRIIARPRRRPVELHQGVVVYVPRGLKHKAWGNLKVLVVCIPRGVLHDVHELE